MWCPLAGGTGRCCGATPNLIPMSTFGGGHVLKSNHPGHAAHFTSPVDYSFVGINSIFMGMGLYGFYLAFFVLTISLVCHDLLEDVYHEIISRPINQLPNVSCYSDY